ncbi:MAG: GTP-binding protein EngB [Candidatus Heimdallarchaeota archaeon]
MEEFSWYLVFIGRPNAGKSSLISRLTSAKPTIGKKPGSTRKINEYILTNKFTVVDVPGWGKIHDRTKEYEERIKDEIISFFEEYRYRIPACILVIDAKSFVDVSNRLSKKDIIPIDQELYSYLLSLKIKPIVAINKIDKVSPIELEIATKHFKELIGFEKLDEELQRMIVHVSAKQGKNLGALRDLIRERLVVNHVEDFQRFVKVR